MVHGEDLDALLGDEPFVTGRAASLLGTPWAAAEAAGRVHEYARALLDRLLWSADPAGRILIPGSDSERRWTSAAPELKALRQLAASPVLRRSFSRVLSWQPAGDDGWRDVARALQDVFKDLREYRDRVAERLRPVSIDLPSLDRQDYDGGNRRNVLAAVDELGFNAGVFGKVAVHGSYATLDESPGVSDVDLAVVLTDEAISSAEALLDSRRGALGVWKLLQQVDPLQHHGPFVYTTIDLRNYPQTILPMAVWRHARAATVGTMLAFACRPTALARRRVLRRAASHLRQPVPVNLFDLKLYLQVVLLAPVFACQHAGRFVYKRDAFRPFEKTAPAAAQLVVSLASQARSDGWYGDDLVALDAIMSLDEEEAPPALLSAGMRQRAARIRVRGRLTRLHGQDIRLSLDALAAYLDSLIAPLTDDADEEWAHLTGSGAQGDHGTSG